MASTTNLPSREEDASRVTECERLSNPGFLSFVLFNGIGSLEIRAVTDAADQEAPQRFDVNLPIATANLASLLRLWLG